MKIYLATDHAGFELKEKVKQWLKKRGYAVHDEGAFELNGQDDYPDFVRIAARQVSGQPEGSRAIIFGGTGQGEAMVANREPGVRAAVYYGGDERIIALSREHNNANVLSLGARFLNEEEAWRAVELWLKTPFGNNERHARRINKIDHPDQSFFQPNA